uniref:HEPN domain-containing protein n=1 Tax=viral metagenome TaxID=1070528 RepID=A0A6C0JWI6_9ZZZZ
MSSSGCERLECEIADNPMSENDKMDIRDAYKVYSDAYNKSKACIEDTWDVWYEAHKAVQIAFDNFLAIRRRLIR